MSRRAGVVELSLGGRGPSRAFVFDPHRLALPCWAEGAGDGPALLVTLDRHFDTVPPREQPAPGLGADALEAFARERCDARNFDHVLAAMAAGVVSHALVVARARPPGAVVQGPWVDGRGVAHELVAVPTVDLVSAEFGTPRASPESRRVEALLREARRVVLDVDVDCFTTPSDADPTTVVPWPLELVRDFVRPRGSEAFWDAVLAKCVALTVAREPGHCGGLVAGGRLFEVACRVLFEELLGADLP